MKPSGISSSSLESTVHEWGDGSSSGRSRDSFGAVTGNLSHRRSSSHQGADDDFASVRRSSSSVSAFRSAHERRVGGSESNASDGQSNAPLIDGHRSATNESEAPSRFQRGVTAQQAYDEPSRRAAESAAVARFEELRRELPPGNWSAALSELDMSLLPPDLSNERSHAEMKARRSAQRRAMKSPKAGGQTEAAIRSRHKELLRRLAASKSKRS